MELGQFEPRAAGNGDRLQAKEAVDRPFVVLVREHRTGIVTQYNPPPGGAGVAVDVADVTTNEVWIDVLWLNPAIVDNLVPYLGQPVAIKLVWTPSAKGGNPYIGVVALEGQQLTQAQQWVAANSTRFDAERVQRPQQARQGQPTAAVQQSPASVTTTTAPPPPPAQQTPPTAPPTASTPGATLDPNDPAVQALLAQITAGQTPPSAS